MIKYSLPQSGIVKLVVYDVLGREVRTLVNGAMPAGAQETQWDGKNSNGQTVGSGIYFYKLTAGSFTATKKMTLIK
jgi:flagellar hook assembly protein FlgD